MWHTTGNTTSVTPYQKTADNANSEDTQPTLSYVVAVEDICPLPKRVHEQVNITKRKSTRITVLPGTLYKEMVKISQKDSAAGDKNKKLKIFHKRKRTNQQLAFLTAALFVGKQSKRTGFSVDTVKSGHIRLL